MSQPVKTNSETLGTPAPPFAADIFAGDATECVCTTGASAAVCADASSHGWRLLVILSALMGFASIYHVSPQFYGLLFAAGILGIMATNLINAKWVMQLGSARLLRAGSTGAALAALVLALNARTGWGGLTGLAVPLFLFVGMAGFIIANSISGALADFPKRPERCRHSWAPSTTAAGSSARPWSDCSQMAPHGRWAGWSRCRGLAQQHARGC